MSNPPFAEYAAIAHSMKGVDFPTDRKHLIEIAKSHKADETVMKDLDRLPERQYKNVADVMHALGHHQ